MEHFDGEGAVASSGRDGEPFRLPLSEDNVAVGRLGRIYKALDRKTCRMMAVERVDVVTNAGDKAPVDTMTLLLADDIRRCNSAGNSGAGHHVFSYESIHYCTGRIYMRSTASVVRSLAGVQQDFGQLHPLAVKQYMYQVVSGLDALHKSEMTCGGLSLSSLLLCGGNSVKIAAWFPPVATMKAIQSQNILVDSQFCRLPLSANLKSQDMRSVAYIMIEMLTGLRVRGALMEKKNLFSKVTAGSPEHQFLYSLLESASLDELLVHPYFSSVNPAVTATLDCLTQAAQEQRHIIGILTKQELSKSQEMKRQYLQQIRVWQAQFEKKYQRKPKPADRPAGIVRLQGRCQALNERMQELNDRLATAHGSVYRMVSSPEQGGPLVDASSHARMALMPEQVDASQYEDVVDSASEERQEGRTESFERNGGKRSPAQKAFLSRFRGST